jgi:ATP-dependent RNA helicase DDX3X
LTTTSIESVEQVLKCKQGRAGNTGKSTAFFNMSKDKGIVKELVEILGEAKQDVPEWLEKCKNQAEYGGFGGRGGRGGRGRGRGSRFGATDFRKEGGGASRSGGSGWGGGGGASAGQSWF